MNERWLRPSGATSVPSEDRQRGLGRHRGGLALGIGGRSRCTRGHGRRRVELSDGGCRELRLSEPGRIGRQR
jgi:hypothetical protein